MRPKIVSDFDGVFTEVRAQAAVVDRARVDGIVERSGWARADVESCLAAVHAAVQRAPAAHGWLWEGRISAFADEDPFLMHNALVAGIGQLAGAGDERATALRDALLARGVADLDAFGSELFLAGSRAFLADGGHAPAPGAVEALRAMLAVADVTFCTNFVQDAVAGTLRRHGFDPGEAGSGAPLVVRGLARKQALTADPARDVTLAGRRVAVDRGHYLAALRDELPVLVVGDVLSLDLALVLGRRHELSELRDVRCVLMRADHTPAWTLDACAADHTVRVVSSPAELAAVTQELVSPMG